MERFEKDKKICIKVNFIFKLSILINLIFFLVFIDQNDPEEDLIFHLAGFYFHHRHDH
jgi:hypothetical protein